MQALDPLQLVPFLSPDKKETLSLLARGLKKSGASETDVQNVQRSLVLEHFRVSAANKRRLRRCA